MCIRVDMLRADKLVLSLTPLLVTFVDDLWWHLTLPLSRMMIQSAVAQVTPDFFFQHRAVSGGRAMQSKLVMWKSWDFLTQFVQVIIWLLVKWQWGVAELAFAWSRMGSLIEAVSRSAEEKCSNQVIMLWEISIWNVSCAEHLWNVILKSEHFSVIWKLEQLSFWVIKYCASIKLMFST